MLPIPHSFPVMEATTVTELPAESGWQFEPKWDGFRGVAFRDGHRLNLMAKNGRQLTTAFPEITTALQAIAADHFVLDGELVVPVGDHLSFDDLSQRLHPAAARLARERPALFVLFDLLVDDSGESLIGRPLVERRVALEDFADHHFAGSARLRLSPATTSLCRAHRWCCNRNGVTDGVVAKRIAADYRSGLRDGMVKLKPVHTVDCVVGGFTLDHSVPDRLLLGLFDDEGLLHHVGTSALIAGDLGATLQARLIERPPGAGFTGCPPPESRGSGTSAWIAADGETVVEVHYDQVAHDHFRHAAHLVRYRVDKPASHCHLDQLDPPKSALPALLRRRPLPAPVG